MTQTLFKKIDYSLDLLLHNIELGEIGLPDIQRPFVWKPTRVRDLFDSMFKGFPVGFLLFWANDELAGTKQIGLDSKQKRVPRLLIVDGQQRLTSLYAVLRGEPVLNADYEEQRIRIAFRPRDGRFEVLDAPIEKDPEFISDLSELWSNGGTSFSAINDFLGRLGSARDVPEGEKDAIVKSIDRVFDLRNYPFTALEISSSVDEERVADIFVRINGEGVKLNQADFILTLLSVFWDEGRHALEDFAREAKKPAPGPSSFNHHIQPDPDQLLRVDIAVGFGRGRLQSVYQILRGKNPETGLFSEEERDKQFARLRDAQDWVLNLTNWHEFLKCLTAAGFRSRHLISSQTSVLYTYALYLLGRRRYELESYHLRRLMSRWFFMAALTSRYSASSETVMDEDLARLRSVEDAATFEQILEHEIEAALTGDYWRVTLPNNLVSSSVRAPGFLAYQAALNILGAPALFSRERVPDVSDPSVTSTKSAVERHHLFPRAYLESQGITEIKEINQVANLTLVEWSDNTTISGKPPAQYAPLLSERFTPSEVDRMEKVHALPPDWTELAYDEFLSARRVLMANVIKTAFEKLRSETVTQEVGARPIDELLATGESSTLELKASARYNQHTGQRDEAIEQAIVKTVAGFLNAQGGTLLIGISDSRRPVGLVNDYALVKKHDRDGYELWLTDMLRAHLGTVATTRLTVSFAVRDGHDICRVEVDPAMQPAFVNLPGKPQSDEFFVRINNSTRRLTTTEFLAYRSERWP